ncbi:MAG: transcriptional regulator [Bacteroidetes bacterium]|jgi:DNA-binding HxlR family transcriptional regulator|nr:MAG: transcriptional regulator [Bacteroidota bacterium]TAE68839.1 MAG: transcriptional regulator [Bacteroidota bacterium]
MKNIKLNSTNQLNKTVLAKCPVTHTLDVMGGRWKPILLWELSNGSRRYGELKKALPAITEKVLIEKLKELEADGLVKRIALPVVPPHVTYELTKEGASLQPILLAMATWGKRQLLHEMEVG